MTSFKKDDRVDVFSNGHEFRIWQDGNCHRGEKGCRKYRPDAVTSRDGCPIEVSIALASCTDGKIPARIALRGNFLSAGPNGTLTDDHLWATASDGHPARVIPACPEFKGYDEPDDRPRRGSRPPKEQLDLLDPRNVPERPRVRA